MPQSRPTELSGATDRAAALLADRPSHERFALLQQVVKRRTNARALGPVPWPASLGTPPWGAARVARYPGVRWTHRMVDDTRPDEVAALWDLVAAAVRRGVPVPLYAGGDSSGGWQTAVPRHVVLAVGVGAGDALTVFEPSSGRLVALEREGVGTPPRAGRLEPPDLGRAAGLTPASGAWRPPPEGVTMVVSATERTEEP